MNPARSPSQEFSLDRLHRAGPVQAPQSFGRFEFKYVISERLREPLERELHDFMEIDPFCRNRPDQSYRVRSLYYDDPGFGFYYEKIDGLLNREKYRLRSYDAPGTAPCYLELKGRQNHFSFKFRSPLDARQQSLIARRRWSALAAAGGSLVGERFAAIAIRRNLSPQVVVEYLRRPYVGRRDYRFRVTFDSEIRGFVSEQLDRPGARAARILPGRTVLEIKFEHAVPVWFQRLVCAYELQRTSVSKYCRAAEALTLVRNLE